MAILYREIFGEMLALLPSSWEAEAFDGITTGSGNGVPSFLPSPEQLKGKILVKGKRRRTSFNSRYNSNASPLIGSAPPSSPADVLDPLSLSEFDVKNSGDVQDPSASPPMDKKDKEVANEKIAEELSQVNYLSGVKFKDLTSNTSGKFKVQFIQ